MPVIRKVLAFDTALFGCSVALYDAQEDVCVPQQKFMPRGQAEILVPMVQQSLEKAEASFSEIDMVATTVGPGAFTGLRIGLSTAQAFGLALNIPVVGLTTLEILALMFFERNSLPDGHLLCVLIETKRADYYCQFFKADGSESTSPQALSDEAIREFQGGQDVLYIGDAIERFSTENKKASENINVCEGYDLPNPCVMAVRALEKYKKGHKNSPEPLYLREADVSSPKKEQRVILES